MIRSKKIKKESTDRKKMFWFLTANLVVFAGLYVYLVSDTTYSIILRQRTEKSISELQSDIGSLETDYLNSKNAVTADLARSKGFREITATKFVSRNSNTATAGLSLNGGR